MSTVRHRFLDHHLNPATETLIIGTFNPEALGNSANFFYGRNRNFLWTLLPTAYQEGDLKKTDNQEKITFIEKRKIDYIDLISEIIVEKGQEANFDDEYIDNKVSSWRDVISEIDQLKNIKRVCFTRKTFSGIPNMKRQVKAIQEHCESRDIYFKAIVTPARYYSNDKQTEWTNFLLNDNR
ncbi:MAG TPA: hypothetical protein VMV77_01735 [Bacteroidales bacterium]|nr:hypothetical protein [Bacteroidales bacterium]